MKKFTTLALASLFCAQAFAGTACETAYERKIGNFSEDEMLANNRGFLTTLGGSVGLIALLSAINPGVMVAMTGFVVIEGVSLGFSHFEQKREDSILSAYGVVRESGMTREAFIDDLEKAHNNIQKFYASERLQSSNEARVAQGLPAQTLEEYIRENPLKPFNRDVKTNIDALVDVFNHESAQKVSYEQVSRAIQTVTHDAKICSGDVVPKMKTLKKLVKQTI